MFVWLDDPEFNDFNFSSLFDPSLKPGGGPNEAALYKLVEESRREARGADNEFADAMDWTLRPASFESFQRVHGPRPIDYRDWFYSKLLQFLSILVHDDRDVDGGPRIQPDDVEAAFLPTDAERYDWIEVVRLCAHAESDRFPDYRISWNAALRMEPLP